MNKIIKWIIGIFKTKEIEKPKVENLRNFRGIPRAERRRMWLNSWYKFKNL